MNIRMVKRKLGIIMERKLIFFDGTLGAGGAEKVISLLSDKLCSNGKKVEILLYYDSEIFCQINTDVKIIKIEKETGSKNIFKNLLYMRKYIKENAEVVISFIAIFNIYALLAMLGLKIPIIVSDRNDPRKIPKKKFWRIIRNFAYNFADGIVVQTQHNQEYFKKSIQKKSIVIYNPVNLKESYGVALHTKKEKNIVSVGRLTEQKDQKLLIKAFSEVNKIYPEYTLIIYGEGPMREELEKYAKELSLSSKVKFPGKIKNVHQVIKSAEMFVLTSKYEGMPNALIEAMCLGMPVISTRVSGASDLIKNEENGLLTDVGDENQLKNAILLYLNNSELKNKCATNAVSVKDKLYIDEITNKWMDYINTIKRIKYRKNETDI